MDLRKTDLRWNSVVAVAAAPDAGQPAIRAARFADLAVVPTPYGKNRGAEDVIVLEALLFNASCPPLIVPDGNKPSMPDNVVIGWNESAEALRRCPPGGMVFCNLVDFDQSFGHRRDVAGYATALEDFDQRLRACLSQWRAEDLLLLTADHGNDPTWTGSDHTREHIPILLYSPALRAGSIGLRSSFADVGQSLSAWFELPVLDHGHAFLPPAPTEVSAGLAQRHQ